MSIEGRPDRARSIADHPRRAGRGRHADRHRRRVPPGADEVGHNEALIAEALATYGGDTTDVLVATKGGHLRPGDGSWTLDGTPEHLQAACDASLKRLGVEAIGLYQFHRPDPKVPYADSVGALGDLLDAGKIRMAGISNADPDQIRAAQEILGGRLVSVQNQFSPAFRSSEPELRLCERARHRVPALEPAGRHRQGRRPGRRTPRSRRSRPAHGVSPQQVTLAWMLATSPVVIPIPGSSRPETIRDSAAAADLRLTDDELATPGRVRRRLTRREIARVCTGTDRSR